MKLFRNPIAVGILAVGAVFMLYWNVVRPLLGPGSRRRVAVVATPSKPANSQPPNSRTSGTLETISKMGGAGNRSGSDATQPKTEPAPSLDWAAVQGNASRWVQAPRRDPFHGRTESLTQARQLLTLKAIWRQTGQELAVINNRLVAEGDGILEFSVDKIEGDQVWVTGPNGREALTFILSAPSPNNPESSTNLESEVRP